MCYFVILLIYWNTNSINERLRVPLHGNTELFIGLYDAFGCRHIQKFIQRGLRQLSLIYYLNWIPFAKDRFGCDQFTISFDRRGTTREPLSIQHPPPVLSSLPLSSVYFTGGKDRIYSVLLSMNQGGVNISRLVGPCMLRGLGWMYSIRKPCCYHSSCVESAGHSCSSDQNAVSIRKDFRFVSTRIVQMALSAVEFGAHLPFVWKRSSTTGGAAYVEPDGGESAQKYLQSTNCAAASLRGGCVENTRT